MNCIMGAIMVTILILSTFIIYELNINSEQVVNDSDPRIILKNLKIANPNKIIIAHLNINSIRNKFECLTYIIDKYIDILLIFETKLNDTFPERQFVINGTTHLIGMVELTKGTAFYFMYVNIFRLD